MTSSILDSDFRSIGERYWSLTPVLSLIGYLDEWAACRDLLFVHLRRRLSFD